VHYDMKDLLKAKESIYKLIDYTNVKEIKLKEEKLKEIYR